MHRRNVTSVCARTLLLSVLAALVLTAGCKSYEVETRWAAEPVKVNGQMTEWADLPLTYIKDSGVQLALRNDNENLYVLFCFYDATWARAIRMGGVTVWLNDSGKKKKDFGKQGRRADGRAVR